MSDQQLVTNRERKNLFTNIFSLGTIHFLNYFLSLITIPYLVRVLGPENYGLTAFAASFTMIFYLITNYGFNFSSTRNISKARNNTAKVNEIFSSVLIIKFFLSILCFLLLLIIISFSEKFKENYIIYYLSFGTVIGHALNPIWFFQGIERMKYITVLELTAKLIFASSIFIFIKNSDDFYLVPLFTSLGYIVSGIMGLLLAIYKFKARLFVVDLKSIFFYLKDGWNLFISSVFSSSYTNLIPFILGLITNNFIVGLFTPILKIMQAIRGLLNPISQALFPLMSKKFDENIKGSIGFLNKTSMVLMPLFFLLCLAIFLASDVVIQVFLGPQFLDSKPILQILSFVPLLGILSNIYGIQFMVNSGYDKQFSKFVVFSSLMALIFCIPLTFAYSSIGSALSIVIGELLLMLLVLHFLIRETKV